MRSQILTHTHTRSFFYRLSSSLFLGLGGLLLLIEALSWAAWFLTSHTALVGYLDFWVGMPQLFCGPFICLGVLAVLIGLLMRRLRKRGNSQLLQLSGALTLGMGLLAIVFSLLFFGGSDLGWGIVVMFTFFCAGLPLTSLGLVLLAIGTLKAAFQRREKPQLQYPREMPPMGQ